MPLTKTRTPQADGSIREHYEHDGTPGETALFTGPIYGSIEVADGTVYRVNDAFIAVPDHHVGQVSHVIGLRHEEDGHPDHGDPHAQDDEGNYTYVPFIHECTEHCGAMKRPAKDHPKPAELAAKHRGQVA